MHIIGADTSKGAHAAKAHVKDGSDATFQADVLEASLTQPVIVDFWAPWCTPCLQLGPVLEAEVEKAGGAVKMVKINIDEHKAVAQQLRIQSIPAVFAFDKGQPVDGFAGVIAPSEIAAFVARLTGSGDAGEADAHVARGDADLEKGDIGGAAQEFAAALQIDPQHVPAIAGMARAYLANGNLDEAREFLDAIPADKANDPAVVQARAALTLAQNAAPDEELRDLIRAVETHPADHAARFALAQGLAGRGDMEGARDSYLAIIEADREWNEGAARTALLELFEAAGPTSDVAKEGRRRLSALLFS